jgi:hypothetical protein
MSKGVKILQFFMFCIGVINDNLREELGFKNSIKENISV